MTEKLNEYIHQCENSPIWMEAICSKNRTSKDMVVYALSQFKLHAIATGEIYYAPKDFMGHFTNWLTINISKLSLPKKAQPKPQEQATVGNVDKDGIMKQACRDALEKVRVNGWYNDPGNSCYGWLERNGYLKFTASEKHGFIEQAKEKERMKLGKPVNYEEHRRFNSLISELETKNTPDVIVLAKKIAVNNFLKTMINEGKLFEF